MQIKAITSQLKEILEYFLYFDNNKVVDIEVRFNKEARAGVLVVVYEDKIKEYRFKI